MEEEEGRGGEGNVTIQALSGGVKFLRADLGKRCLLSPNSDTLTLDGQRELTFAKAFTPTTMVYQNSLSNRPSSAYPLPLLTSPPEEKGHRVLILRARARD